MEESRRTAGVQNEDMSYEALLALDANNVSKQLDYFGALVDIDVQIGRVRSILKEKGYAKTRAHKHMAHLDVS